MQLLSEVADQKRVIAELREENARLKGLKGRPRIKPSGMEGEPAEAAGQAWRWAGKIVPRVSVEDQIIRAEVPAGARFKATRLRGAGSGAAGR